MNSLKINLFLKTSISSASTLIPYMHPVPAVLYYIQMALHIPQKYSLWPNYSVVTLRLCSHLGQET